MSLVPLEIKWGKTKFKLDFDPDKGVDGLRSQLQKETGVPCERMKIMAKSKGTYASIRILFESTGHFKSEKNMVFSQIVLFLVCGKKSFPSLVDFSKFHRTLERCFRRWV
mmetsp:Transcript_26289/g.29092  ORF Transcript_26289/g.29092 Transcript_26289/m.29092 type:complete len:110 (-) Transcript_26289:1674-2003(-)